MKTFAKPTRRHTPRARRAAEPSRSPSAPSAAVRQILHPAAPVIQRKLLVKKSKADATASTGAAKYLKYIGFADDEFTLRPVSEDRVQVDFTFSQWPRVIQQEIPWRMAKSREDHVRTPKELQKDIAFKSHVANYAKAMARGDINSGESKHSFGTLRSSCKMAPEFWKVRFNPGNTLIQVKEGVRPSLALADLWSRPKEYSLECFGTVMFIQLRALLRSLGPAEFDRRFGILVATGPNDNQRGIHFMQESIRGVDDMTLLLSQGQEEKDVGSDNNFRELIPGDSVYFAKRRDSKYVQVDNGVYVGQGLFYVHPFGLFTKRYMLDKKKKVLTRRRYRWERWNMP